MTRPDFNTQTHGQIIKLDQYSPHFFFTINLQEPKYYWTGEGNIYYPLNNITYSGQGQITNMDLLPESGEIRIQNSSVALSYLDPEIKDLIDNQPLKGVVCEIHLGIITNNKIVDNLIHLQTFKIDTIEIDYDDTDGDIANIQGIAGLTNLTYPTRLKYTSEDHNEYITELQTAGIISINRPLDIGFDSIKALTGRDETAEWNEGPAEPKLDSNPEPSILNGGKINRFITT